MPVELSPFRLRRTLAALRAEDPEAAIDVEGALQWPDGRESDAEPLLLRRYDLQLFLWYLPVRGHSIPARGPRPPGPDARLPPL